MAFSCAFDAGFDSGFEICATAPPAPETPTLRGVPSAIPKPRKRPDVREASGYGLILVVGAGTATREAALSGELLQPVEGYGRLVRDAFGYLIGAIRHGAEAVLAGEAALVGAGAWRVNGAAILARECMAAGAGAVDYALFGRMRRERAVIARGAARSGAEARLRTQESDEPVIVAAGLWIARRLTRRR